MLNFLSKYIQYFTQNHVKLELILSKIKYKKKV